MTFKKINDVSCKNSTVATFVDFSDVDPITRRDFKTSALNRFEYFASLEMMNSLMVDVTGMDEKFAMMDQTIEALKKSIDEKNFQIAELIGKLDLYNSGESHHILTTQEKVDVDSPTKPVPSTYSSKSERSYRDVNLSMLDIMRSLLASLSPKLKDKMHRAVRKVNASSEFSANIARMRQVFPRRSCEQLVHLLGV
ncbi:hypothetical protein H5410_014212 [Solanum commersonii]|uniref:Uncharacterized protein n=1 Tax=Solanum commersonii TaxID=4109 RepID=A0A9J5ZQP9_SOLCO|nr:hypothetical protein H5410_014212 [Solanum commersonii]